MKCLSRIAVSALLACALLACAFAGTPLRAELAAGAEDPAYRAALASVLENRDQESVRHLKTLAEAGNGAATAVLPFALMWSPPTGTLAERNAFRRIGGTPINQAAAAGHPASAAWIGAIGSPPQDLIRRAEALVALNEPQKAALLLANYVHMTGLRGIIPDIMLAGTTPDWLIAIALGGRLIFESQPGDGEVVLALLRQDRAAGWQVLARLIEANRLEPLGIAEGLKALGIDSAAKTDRLRQARLVRDLDLGGQRKIPATAEAVGAAARSLEGRMEFVPVSQFCSARCADSLASCERAFLAFPGLPHGRYESAQPFVDLMSAEEFMASDFAASLLLSNVGSPTRVKDLALARSLDACYASLLDAFAGN